MLKNNLTENKLIASLLNYKNYPPTRFTLKPFSFKMSMIFAR
ncbi:hypothetical protein JM81_0575 [Maribacter sp. MAR_2009_72]|nr:hypothetical protein JM81_0575 [Maribacter sp. MAR_2009_72]